MPTKKEDKTKKSSDKKSSKDSKSSSDKKSSSTEKKSSSSTKSTKEAKAPSTTPKKEETPVETTPAVDIQPKLPQSKENDSQICENCHTHPATHFCIECNLLLCQTCDMSIHGVSAFSGHSRRNSWEAQLYRHPCRFHPNKYVVYFCTTCDEPICADCRLNGPHHGAGHTIVSIRDAFYSKLQQITQRVQGPLRGKRDALTTVAAKIEGDIQRVHSHANEIERATRLDYEGIISRLKRAEGMLTAVCQQDLDLVRADIYAIDSLMKYLSNISISDQTKNPIDILRNNMVSDMYNGLNFNDMPFNTLITGNKQFNNNEVNTIPYNAFQLLQQLPSLHAQIDGILARTPESYISPQSQVDLAELPTEAKDRAELMGKTRDSIHKIEVKEELLKMAETEKEEAIKMAREELSQWEALTSKYANELKKVSMKCVFCGANCEPTTVNQKCKKNFPSDFQANGYQAARKAEPILNSNPDMSMQEAMTYVGNSRHFFVKKLY